MNSYILTQKMKDYAKSIGFQDIGVSKSEILNKESLQLESWLKSNYCGEMDFMHQHFDLRIDPQKLHYNTKSIISFTYNYFIDEPETVDNEIKISKYSRGRDYHKVVYKKLKLVVKWLKNELGDVSARAFLDSAPVMERVWAEKSGVGWTGKHSLMLTKGKGSFFFLGEIFIDYELAYDGPVKNYCGTCTKCIDACPTQAIIEPYKVDGSRCISYLTIEYKKANLPKLYTENNQGWAYGCDICQDVCPINARAKSHTEPEFNNRAIFSNMSLDRWSNLSEDEFNEVFHGSAIKRAGYNGLMRNIKAIKNKMD